MRLPLTIDGVDFSVLANKYEYSISYSAREGSNSGIMLNGDKTIDVLVDDDDNPVYKATITWNLNDMKDTDLMAIQSAVLKPYCSVTFFDTRINDERTATMIPSLSESNIGILRATKWWKHPTLTLEEK